MRADDRSDVRHGSSSLRSTISTIGHPARSSSTGSRTNGTAGSVHADDRRARRSQQHRCSCPSGALDDHVAGVPGRVALLLQRLVVLIDHDGHGQLGARCPRRAAGADHHVGTGGGERPLTRHDSDAAIPGGSGRRPSPRRARPSAWRPASARGSPKRRWRRAVRRPAAGAAGHRRRRAPRPRGGRRHSRGRRRGRGQAPARP